MFPFLIFLSVYYVKSELMQRPENANFYECLQCFHCPIVTEEDKENMDIFCKSPFGCFYESDPTHGTHRGCLNISYEEAEKKCQNYTKDFSFAECNVCAPLVKDIPCNSHIPRYVLHKARKYKCYLCKDCDYISKNTQVCETHSGCLKMTMYGSTHRRCIYRPFSRQIKLCASSNLPEGRCYGCQGDFCNTSVMLSQPVANVFIIVFYYLFKCEVF